MDMEMVTIVDHAHNYTDWHCKTEPMCNIRTMALIQLRCCARAKFGFSDTESRTLEFLQYWKKKIIAIV